MTPLIYIALVTLGSIALGVLLGKAIDTADALDKPVIDHDAVRRLKALERAVERHPAGRGATMKRWSCCPSCGEPLVSSLVVRGAEWVCPRHEPPKFYPMFSAFMVDAGGDPKHEAALDARWRENRAAWAEIRQEPKP